VCWSEENGSYVGYCPDLFPWGGVCHGVDKGQTYRLLTQLVHEEVAQLTAAGAELPVTTTRAPLRHK
jgi:hypothetical protein